MTIPEAAKQAGISKPAAYKKINHALQAEGLNLADIMDPQTKQILDDRITWVTDLLTKKRQVTGKVNQEDPGKINHSLLQQLTAAREEILRLEEEKAAADQAVKDLQEQLNAARDAAVKNQEEILRLKQHEDLLIQQNAAQTITINRMTEERLHITEARDKAAQPVEELKTFRQRLTWLLKGKK